jgi:hypothetical protein
MDSASRRDALVGFLICIGPMAAIAFWVGATSPATDLPDYTTPNPQTHTWTPEVAPNIPDEPQYGPEEDCGDGTRGTFAECWERIKVDASREAAEWAATVQPTHWPAPTAWPSRAATPVVPALTLPPAVGTVCGDGTLSHSTGRGTCSWHGGIAR